MIDSTIFFKSEKGNSYLYDSNTKELLNIHPVVVMIHELNKHCLLYTSDAADE